MHVVLILDGFYNYDNLKITKNNVILQADNIGKSILSGNQFSVFGDNVTCFGFKFINGNAFENNFIQWSGNNGIIVACDFINNNINNNSVLYWTGLSGLVEDCIFLNNTVSTNTTSENSNVVYWTGNNGTLKHSIFKYNNGTTGAVYWIGDNGNINYCNFTFNLASYKGGAILWEGINGILSNSLFLDNYVKYSDDSCGGAVYWSGVKGVIKYCNFTGNTANGINSCGGAVYWSGIDGICIDSNFVNGNASKGGSIYWDGNNGSIDGDSPAAYRYTEARLSKISNEMLRDINKDTVEMAPNFDDTTLEPTVLPARFPALLVYGAMGISAGYATNIPPHNLGEVIDATIHRIDNPNCSLDTLMKYVKGPDFPTGGIVEGIKGIRDAYETGKGRVIIRSKYEFVGNSLIITEIPFEVNKALLVKKIDDIRLDKRIDGIIEVRDESAEDVRIVVDLKKSANKELIVNYLLKNTDLQISYNFNMIAIVKKRPRLLGLKQALDAFIDHQKEVITRRSQFDLDHAKSELHIVEGLIKCLSILDEVIRVIRASKNKADAKENLVKEFDFSFEQAEAIVTLQLYRLTNTDVVELEERMATLRKIIEGLTAMLMC